MKRFLEWFPVKMKLDAKENKPPLVSEGDIWWASLGENIGTEVNGKSAIFSRPVIILKRLSRETYFVIPATTQNHSGSWYVPYTYDGQRAIACLHQARSIDYRRLFSKLGIVEERAMAQIQKGFNKLYGG
jgi:mRNA interferase MazF